MILMRFNVLTNNLKIMMQKIRNSSNILQITRKPKMFLWQYGVLVQISGSMVHIWRYGHFSIEIICWSGFKEFLLWRETMKLCFNFGEAFFIIRELTFSSSGKNNLMDHHGGTSTDNLCHKLFNLHCGIRVESQNFPMMQKVCYHFLLLKHLLYCLRNYFLPIKIGIHFTVLLLLNTAIYC